MLPTFARIGAALRHRSRICSRKRDDVCLFGRNWREAHTLRLRNAVLAPQMTVGFHCECTAVFMSKPTRDCWNIHSALNANSREQVPQVVMRDAIRANFLACAIERLLAFADTEKFRVQ
jgi:hypothetical protein